MASRRQNNKRQRSSSPQLPSSPTIQPRVGGSTSRAVRRNSLDRSSLPPSSPQFWETDDSFDERDAREAVRDVNDDEVDDEEDEDGEDLFERNLEA